MPKLTYIMDEAIKKLGIRGSAVVEISGLTIRPADLELEELKQQATGRILSLSDDEIQSDIILQSYRRLVEDMGRSLKKFPPAAENLVRQVRRTCAFPSINTAVDCYNIVAAARSLALGAHDLAKLGDTIYFRLSGGGEPFTPVGSTSTKFTQQGDFVYADSTRVLAWLDSKDCDDAKISLTTESMIIVIQGTDKTSREYNMHAAAEAGSLINRFCGGYHDVFAID